MQRVVVIGAGNMGGLVSYLAASSDCLVTLIDPDPNAIASATARHKVMNESSATGGTVPLQIVYYCGNVDDSAIRHALLEANIVVEAIVENRGSKAALFMKLEELTPPETIYGTVSSSIPVSEFTGNLVHQGRVCNIHFLQQGIAAVEVMPGERTSDATIETVCGWLESMGMVPFVVKRFFFNLIWRAVKKTSLGLVRQGIATPHQIDRIWMMALKTTIGPFGMMDWVGLHTVAAIEREYAAKSGDPDDEPPEFLLELIRGKQTGMRAGSGFYRYPSPDFRVPGFLETGLTGDLTTRPIRVIRETLVRSWKLVRFAAETPEGVHLIFPMGADAQGTLTYTPDGRVWVYLSRADRAKFVSDDPMAGTPEECAAAYRSFFSYSGTFAVGRQLVVHRIEQSSFPNWVGRAELRHMSIENGLLVLKTDPMTVGNITGVQKLTWAPT